MYIFPGYVTYEKENNSVVVSSNLLRNKIKISDPALRKEFLLLYSQGGCHELSSRLTQFLHDQELLLDEEELKKTLENVKSFLMDRLLLTIMPTEACNFCCPYCYENHLSKTMSDELIARLCEYIKDSAPKYKDVCVSWFGGEPTLCKEKIIDISSMIISLQALHNFQYSASMTTNGYLLDVNSFVQYYNVGIKAYQITLDGWKHDVTRPHKSGAGTLETIINNIIDISKLPKDEYQFEIILRRNIMPDDEDLSWYDYLQSLFGKDNRFSVACFPVSNWGGESVKSMNISWSGGKQALVDVHDKYIAAQGLKQAKKENVLLSDVCYASCPNGFVFRADGRIEKCTIALNHPKNLVGQIDPDKGVMILDAANKQWCSGEIDRRCYTCADILDCMNITCKKGIIINGHTESFCMHNQTFCK